MDQSGLVTHFVMRDFWLVQLLPLRQDVTSDTNLSREYLYLAPTHEAVLFGPRHASSHSAPMLRPCVWICRQAALKSSSA